MPKLALSIPHALGQETAADRLKERFRFLRENYGEHITHLEEQWTGHRLDFSFTTHGVTIKGNVAAEPEEVKVDANLPLVAVMFKSRIEEQLRSELGRVLA